MAAPRNRLDPPLGPRTLRTPWPGSVGPGPPRAAEAQRAGQEGRRRAQRPGPDREHLRQRAASPRSTRPTCAAGCAGGASTPSASPASTAARPRSSSRTSSTTSTSCCGSASTAASSTTEQLRVIARDLARSSPATPPTSPTGRTSSCTGSGSRTCRRSGSRLEAVGLSTTEACGDTPRVILGSPGRRHRRRRDHRRHAGRSTTIAERFIGDPEFSNLPRKFKTAISGSPLQDVAHEVNDIVVRRRRAPRARPGLRPLGRRRPVHQPDARPAARRLGAAGRGARGLGRRRRRLPRLRLPPAAHPGPAQVPGRRLGRRRSSARCSRRSTSAAPLLDGPAPPVPVRPARPRRRAPAEATAASTSGSPRPSAGSSARRSAGSPTSPRRTARDRVRTTAEQKLVVLDVPADRVDSLVAAADALGPARPARRTFRRDTMACTGIEFCKLAIVETKARGRQADRRAGAPAAATSTSRSPINVNGCPNSCARIQVADIGLKGQLVARRRRQPGRGLPGPPRRRARAGRRLRPQAARPQGHRRRAARLRRAGRAPLRRRSDAPASGSPSGSPAPTRRRSR